MKPAQILTLPLILLLTGAASQLSPKAEKAPAPSYRPTSDYTRRTVRGWPVLVSNELLSAHPQLAADCLALLDTKLFEVTRVVPPRALERIHDVPIWLEYDDPGIVGGTYHPSREWLAQHGYNPEKAGAIEFGNANHFLSWSFDQPSFVLHELAHAYDHRVLGYNSAEVNAAYQAALKEKLYESVLRINGHTERAYAMNDVHEYFAELSEAYFGTNDFFPFVRAEIARHDPRMLEVLNKVWNQ